MACKETLRRIIFARFTHTLSNPIGTTKPPEGGRIWILWEKVTAIRQLSSPVGVNRENKVYLKYILASYNYLLYHVSNLKVTAESSEKSQSRIQNGCKKPGHEKFYIRRWPPLSKYSRRVDGRYSTRVKNGVGTDGKSIYKALCANTEKELDVKVNSYLRQSEKSFVNPEKTTLAVWLDHWLHNVKRGTVTQATWEFYRCIIQSCINPVIGPRTLAKLTPSDIRTLYL